ncbi:MAG: hypothetical protein PVI86_14245 [Phycisphaerae bacterium]|jgi:hypothetical protein
MKANYYAARFAVTLLLGITVASHAIAQPKGPPEDCGLELRVELPSTEVEAFGPIIAQVALVNTGSNPQTIAAQDETCPYGLSLTTVTADGIETKHSLWLTRNGPQPDQIVLRPGDSLVGQILVLMTYADDMVFTSPGRYTTRWSWASPGCDTVRSRESVLKVIPPSASSVALLKSIEKAALAYFTGEPEPTVDEDDPQVSKALRRQATVLLARIILERIPQSDLVPSGKLDVRDENLVKALESAIATNPNAVLAPYVARYLGRLQAKRFESIVSQSGLKLWHSNEVPSRLETEYAEASKARDQALHYLRQACQDDLWPAEAALSRLARVQLISENWDEVAACTAKLRALQTTNADKAADQLDAEAARYRHKLEERKGRTHE